MQTLFNIINMPLAWILKNIAGLMNGNFAAAVFLFTLIINVVLIPLSIKSQKSAVHQTRIKPKLDDLKKRYGDDKQKYSQAMQKLYQEENVSMAGGCLPMILRLVLMMSIYYLIMSPLSYLMDVDANTIKEATEALNLSAKSATQLNIIDAVKSGAGITDSSALQTISERLSTIDFNLFGINLTQKPEFSFNIFKDFQPTWIMPIVAFVSQILSSLVAMKVQKLNNPDAPSMMGMLLTMPLFSLFIGFTLPGGVSFYWACSSIIGGIIQACIQLFYGPHKMLARERIKDLSKQCDFEEGQLKKLSSSDPE